MTAHSAASTSHDAADSGANGRGQQGIVEDACFETIMSADHVSRLEMQVEQRMPTDGSGIAIFAATAARPQRSDLNYWLFVFVAALTAFWVAGGHRLFWGP